MSPSLRSPTRVLSRWSLRIFSFFCLLVLAGFSAGLVLIPWQQSVVGRGRVIVLSPMQRPQNIEAPIKARLERWHVQEGQEVEEGQLVAELAEVDVKYLDEEQVERLIRQRQAQVDTIEAGRARIDALGAQIRALESYADATLVAADQKIRQAEEKVRAEEEARRAAAQNRETVRLNQDRLVKLHQQGLRSRRDLELGELAMVKAETDLAKAEAAVTVAGQALRIEGLEREKARLDLDGKLAATRVYLAEASEKLAKARSEIEKLDIEIANQEARIAQRRIRSPSRGRVVRLLKAGAGETIKEGDVLAVLAPDTSDRAVELHLSGHDAPLVTPGRHVRLQFAGWPALQFSGWPSVAVGTFGGRVAVVDAIDDGRGRFRVLVVPDPDPAGLPVAGSAGGRPEAWPDPVYLRPGTEVSGWVLLEEVSLGFELWRQFNGFSPALSTPPGATESGKGKSG